MRAAPRAALTLEQLERGLQASSQAVDDASGEEAELAAALALSIAIDPQPAAAAAPAPAPEADEDMDDELRAALALSVGAPTPAHASPGGDLLLARAVAQLGANSLLPPSAAGARKRPRERGAAAASTTTPLPHVLDADALGALATEHAHVRDALLPLLPEGQRSLAQLLVTLRSPQLRQTAMALTAAIDDAFNAGAVYAAFGLQPGDGALHAVRGDATGALVEAVLAAVGRQAAPASGPGAGSLEPGGGAPVATPPQPADSAPGQLPIG